MEEREKERSRSGRRLFWGSLGVTLSLLIAMAGFAVVDCRGRRMSFGDSAPPFHTEDGPDGRKALEIRLFGQDRWVDVTYLDKIFDFLCDFSCIPHK